MEYHLLTSVYCGRLSVFLPSCKELVKKAQLAFFHSEFSVVLLHHDAQHRPLALSTLLALVFSFSSYPNLPAVVPLHLQVFYCRQLVPICPIDVSMPL